MVVVTNDPFARNSQTFSLELFSNWVESTPFASYEKSKSLGSGESMVARLKLKGIDGRAPPGVEPAA